MATEVVIPMLGVTVENGKIVAWLKKEGDAVTKGESIFVVEADKVTTEVESPGSGVLARILLDAGKEVPVLSVVAVITEPGETVPDEYLKKAGGTAAPAYPPAPAAGNAAADYDLAVIGGGPGGYVAAICGARAGLKTVLIEKDALGGTCLNRGCIPTKAMFYDAKIYKSAATSTVLTGVEQLGVDMARLIERKRGVVKTLVAGVGGLVKSHGADVVAGMGRLDGPGQVTVRDAGGRQTVLKVKNIILANGSRPGVPPMLTIDGKFVQTTDEVLDDDTLPKRLVIIGGGVIGIEMAAIFLNLGARVTILELLPDVLMTEDQDVRSEMRKKLKQHKADLSLKAAVQKIDIKGSEVAVFFRDADQNELSITADKVIVATGRIPVYDGIDADALGLETDGPFVKVNEKFETNLPGVYAIGDLIGGKMLAHKASAEAEAVIENIQGASHTVTADQVPGCIWGVMEVGSVGMTEEEARETGRRIKIGKFPLAASGAAQAMGHPEGFVKIIGDAGNGEILGVHIMGEHATDMIAEAISVKAMEGAVEDLSEAIKPHPTVSETVMEAALDWNRLAIHIPRKQVCERKT